MRIVTPPIRFQISVLLLLATFNTVALSAGAASLFAAVLASPSRTRVAAIESFTTSFAEIQRHTAAAFAENAATDPGLSASVSRTEVLLAPVGADAASVREDLSSYKAAVARWNEHLRSPAHLPVGGIEDAAGSKIKREVVRAGEHAVSGARQLVYYTRPRWVDAVEPFLPFLGAWVLLCSVVTVVLAGGLRIVLSRPLERLTLAARAIGQGKFDVPIPPPEGAGEIQLLAVALGTARARTVETIAALDLRNRQTATMLSELGDGVILADAGGTIVESNAQAEAMLASFSREWKRSRQLSAIIPEIEAAWFSGEVDQGTAFERVLAGRRCWFEVSLRRVEHVTARQSGDWVVVIHDVTSAREVENIKRDFMSVMTHELKTPLVTIEGFTKLLLMNKGGELSDKQRAWTTNIREQGQVLLTMVNNMLDATRLEGGSLTIAAAPTLAGELWNSWCNTWRPVVEQRGLTFIEQDGGVGAVKIAVDPFRMQQVVGNLVNNALKFTKAPGQIGISVASDGARVSFVVSDSGRGIPLDAIPHLFQKFYQVEKGDTRVAGGAGLGLYIVHQLVVAQNGRVAVDSAMGQGSRFVLSFPIVDPGVPAS